MSAALSVQPKQGSVRRGIALMLAAVLLFVMLDTTAKYLTRSLPIPEVVWGRYSFHALFVILLFPRRILLLHHSRLWKLQITRSVFLLSATTLSFTSLSLLPIATFTAIGALGPLILTAISGPMLGERVGLNRWMAVIVGFIGVLVIVRPGTTAFEWALIFPLLTALFMALYQGTTTLLNRSEDPITTLFFTAFVGALVPSFVVPFIWQPPTAAEWMLMALTGMLGGLSHFLMIRAFAEAPASVLAPFGYSQLVWSIGMGLLVFGDFPDGWTLLGGAIISGCGLYVLQANRRERPAPAVS